MTASLANGLQPGGEEWPSGSTGFLGPVVEMREDDFVGEERRPFEGGGAIGVFGGHTDFTDV